MTHSSTSSHWYFTKEELIQAYGVQYKAEVAQRRTTVAFLQEAGMKLRQPQLTIATAIVFFHRFFVRHSLKDYDPYTIATTTLFLAGKVEETPKKLRDVILVVHRLRNRTNEDLKQDSKEFWDVRESILSHERTVLQTIAFDLTIEHPYKFLLTYVKNIQGNRQLAQVAWNFVNDSLRTNLCLQYKPQFIASAAIYLASKFLKYTMASDVKKAWWEVLDAKIDELEDISNQILDLYESSSPNMTGLKMGDNNGSFFGPSTPPPLAGSMRSAHPSHLYTHRPPSPTHDPPPPPPPDQPPPPPPPSLPPPPPPSSAPPPPPSSSPSTKPSNGASRTPTTSTPTATTTSTLQSRSRSPSPRRARSSRSRSPRRSRSPVRRYSRSPRRSSRSPRRSSRSPPRRTGSRSPRRSRSPPRRSGSPYRDRGRDRGGYYRRDSGYRDRRY